jgi:hypothetical protein
MRRKANNSIKIVPNTEGPNLYSKIHNCLKNEAFINRHNLYAVFFILSK